MTRPLPSDFSLHYSNIVNQLLDTLHKVELEYAAALIIKWHRQRDCESWISFSREDVATLFNVDVDQTLLEYGRNPFWQPDPMGLVEQGYVKGWEYGPENVALLGRLTEKFFEAVSTTWDRRRPGWDTFGRRTG